ncbi:MAG: hypothetical protein GY716_09850, partial [bacterium]|nr:hypothetical protein [bacterium]
MTRHAIITLLVAACLTAPISARGQLHGTNQSNVCDTPVLVGETLDCELFVAYNDDFGDTWTIHDVWHVVNPGPNETFVFAYEIIGAHGNTTAIVGGELPVNIGTPGSTLGGLPGAPQPGVVILRQNTYVVRETDPSPLPVFTHVVYQDLCDAPGTSGCSGLLLEDIVGGATEVLPDCNANGVDDATDIAQGTSSDVDMDGIPDDCQDCNDNGVLDSIDIANETSEDCNL